jgi:hypothetical protein
MQDPLQNVKTYLLTQGLENIFIDGFVVVADRNSDVNYNQINIQSEPSSTPSEYGHRYIEFGIYVKNKSQQTARDQAKQIRDLLGNKGGKLGTGIGAVAFKKITCITEPYNWSADTNNINIYLVRFSAIISDTDVRLSSYQ